MNSPSGRSRRATAKPVRGTLNWQVVIRPLVGVAIIVFCAVILSNSMTKSVARDEQMYCTAGVLLARGQMIYRDFSYPSQLPYHPLLYAVVFRVTGTTRYLLAGRLVSAVCDLLVLLLIVAIYRQAVGAGHCGTGLGLAGAVLYVFNPLVDYAQGYYLGRPSPVKQFDLS